MINFRPRKSEETAANNLSVQSGRRHTDQIENWISDARAGSSDALGALVSACQSYLLTIAKRRIREGLKSKFGASDLVQETALDAHRDFDSFRGARRNELLAWLRQILVRNAADFERRFRWGSKRQVSREVSLRDVMEVADYPHSLSSTPSQIVSSMEERVRIEQAIARLPKSMQSAILLRNREHMGFAEIGARLGCSPEAARKRWARAIERLQEEIGRIQ